MIDIVGLLSRLGMIYKSPKPLSMPQSMVAAKSTKCLMTLTSGENLAPAY